jgi:hypothetical protein
VRRALVLVALLGSSLGITHTASAEPVTGPQRILVVLATWGPQPFTRADAQKAIFGDADAFYRSNSYGKVWLTGTVTPWLHAFPGPLVNCAVIPLRDAGNAAARAAGYDLSAYDRVVFIHPPAGCPWSGVTFANTVLINGALSRRVIDHELGHAFGLPHANATTCRQHAVGCDATEYGDPFDTMGSGVGDFSAYAKVQLGWITHIRRPVASGTYTLAPLERPSTRAQVFVVTTASDQYWIENRSAPAVNDSGVKVAEPGVTMHLNASPDIRGGPGSDFPHNVLVADPAGRKRPELRPGDRFAYPGAFTLTVLKPNAAGARLRFRWTDQTPPRAPHVSASIVDGRFRVVWEDAHETGSGVAQYVVSVDGGAAVRFGADLTQEPIVVGRALPGSHTVRVVAIDRAGNRSRAGVKLVETQ